MSKPVPAPVNAVNSQEALERVQQIFPGITVEDIREGHFTPFSPMGASTSA